MIDENDTRGDWERDEMLDRRMEDERKRTPPAERSTPISDEPVSLQEAANHPKGSTSRIHQYDAAACCRRFEDLERQLAEARELRESGERILRDQRDGLMRCVESRNKEIDDLREQRDRLARALEKIKAHAVAIQKLRYGWDGDCGAVKIADYIEEESDDALAAIRGNDPTVMSDA